MGGVIANPDLDPETSNTFEIGMKKQLSERTNIGLSLYQVKQMIKFYIQHIINLVLIKQNINNMKIMVQKNVVE